MIEQKRSGDLYLIELGACSVHKDEEGKGEWYKQRERERERERERY